MEQSQPDFGVESVGGRFTVVCGLKSWVKGERNGYYTQLNHNLSGVRLSGRIGDAAELLSHPSYVCQVWHTTQAQTRRLLCFLLLRQRSLPVAAARGKGQINLHRSVPCLARKPVLLITRFAVMIRV